MATWHVIGTRSFNVEVYDINPITGMEVYAPDKVEIGKQVTITVKVYAKRQTQIRGTVSLFGQTQTKTGYAYSTTTPGVLTFTFTAPTREDRYTGSVKVEAYY